MTERAFTIVELMVAAAIFLFIIGGIYGIMNAARGLYDADMGRLDLQSSARRALDSLTAELRQTSMRNISILDDGAEVRFEVPANITSGTVVYSGPILYYINADAQLVREHPADSLKVVAQYMDSLEFCCWNGTACAANCSSAESVIVRMGFNRTYKQRTYLFNVTENVVVRNDF